MTGSPCATCVHFDASDEEKNVCAAFPDGIPDSIFYGGDHSRSIDGDHGITYSPIPEMSEE